MEYNCDTHEVRKVFHLMNILASFLKYSQASMLLKHGVEDMAKESHMKTLFVRKSCVILFFPSTLAI